jgi:hypothetical protein
VFRRGKAGGDEKQRTIQIREMHKEERMEGSINFEPLLVAGDKHSQSHGWLPC